VTKRPAQVSRDEREAGSGILGSDFDLKRRGHMSEYELQRGSSDLWLCQRASDFSLCPRDE
jgi:hypothetical protein